VVGQGKQEKLDRLIGEVARGERTLAGVSDPEMRDAVRLALRLRDDGQSLDTPDEYTRTRMRARVMSGLRPRAPTLRDNAWTALWYLGRPAPYIARAVVIVVLMVSAGMGATVVSADSLPDDALYPVKIAAEGVRLGLAGAPHDRAAVELSIAEHRLAEAERLAMNGRRSDALVASAVYGWHIAAAAAELSNDTDASVGAQLASSFYAQRERAQRLAVELSTDETASRSAEVLAMIAAPSLAPGTTEIERVAETAAALADDLAAAAEEDLADTSAFEEQQVAAADATVDASAQVRGSSTPLAGAAQQATPRGTAATTNTTAATPARTTPRATKATPHPTPNAKASDNAKAARKAADQARAAAEKLRQALLKAREKQDHR
jgi:hypothetical protein